VRVGLLAVACSLAASSLAHAQHGSENHFVYTGPLRVEDEVVARAESAPLVSVEARSDGTIDLSVQHAGLRFEASGDREGLAYHVHTWTAASASGFDVLIAPDVSLELVEPSIESAAVVTRQWILGDVVVTAPRAPPAWTRDRLEGDRQPQCEPFALYRARAEDTEPLPIPAGTHVVRRTSRGGWDDVWAGIGATWAHGFARHLVCARPPAVGRGSGSRGSSGFSEPTRVRLPRGLRLVGRAHPTHVVMEVTEPLAAVAWAPGWTSANDDGAIVIALPCGPRHPGYWTGALTFSPDVLVPLGAP
jgi:hypothetical protein